MKAAALIEPGRVNIIEIAEPTLGAEDVLIDVHYVGLCGSDLNAYRGTSPMVSYPRVIGHEVAGSISAKGPSVPPELVVGAHVTVNPYSQCGNCYACRTGRTNACRNNQTLGVQRDGALTERISIHHRKICTGGDLPLEELALVEPLSVGCHATAVGEVSATDRVAVFGCGAVGLGAVAAAASKGASVIAVDIDDAKLARARSLGACNSVNASIDDPATSIAALTAGDGVTVAIEAVGSPATYQAALRSAATGGRVVCIGYSEKPVELDTRVIIKNELSLLGSRNALDEFAVVIGMMQRRERPFADLISRIVPLTETAAALAEWSASPGKLAKILIQLP